MSSWALKMSLSNGSRRCFSSPEVRMCGGLLSTGSTPYLVADLCQEFDTSSIPDSDAAPSTTVKTCWACPAKVPSEAEDRTEGPITYPIHSHWRVRLAQLILMNSLPHSSAEPDPRPKFLF